MKILLINSMCGSGSTGRIVADLYNLIKSRGDTAKVAYGIGKATGVPPEDIYRITNRAGYYLHNILAKLSDRTGLFSSIETKRLVRWISKFDPDIIHLHNLHGYYINYKILFNYIAKHNKKVIWTLHDCWTFTGHCAHFDKVGCDCWLTGCKKCKHRNLYPRCFFVPCSNSNYNLKKRLYDEVHNMTIVTPSKWLANIVRQSFLKDKSIYVINNGIDLSSFHPVKSDFRARFGIENKTIILGVASVWNTSKGFEDFLRLSKMLDDSYTIVLVGVSDKQVFELSENIIGIKRTNDIKELASIYSTSDVFLNLTYEDTYPTVNLEAIACGLPIVTYDTGGCNEVINAYNGRVVDQGNLSMALSAINEVKSLDRRKIVEASVCFDKKNKYEEYYSLYRNINMIKEFAE